MATNHGNHITKHAGRRAGVAEVDSTSVLIVLNQSHENFTTSLSRLNRTNPGWVKNFIDNGNISESLKQNFTTYTTQAPTVTYPDLGPAIDDVLKSANITSLSEGWQKPNSVNQWINLEKGMNGILYPCGAALWDDRDTKYEIVHYTAKEWFSQLRQESGGNYNRLIYIHGDYNGLLPKPPTTWGAIAPHLLASEGAGWAHCVLNIMGNVTLTPRVDRAGLITLTSDDMQGQVNIFGNLTLNAPDGLHLYAAGQARRGHLQVNIMPGGSLTCNGNTYAFFGRKGSFLVNWGDGKFKGKLSRYTDR